MSGEKVMVVDDEPGIVDVCINVLAQEGYAVSGAYSGHEALEIAKQGRVDALVVDIVMPEMDGLELLQRLHDVYPDIVAVVMTGYAVIDNAVKSVNQGVQGFIVKPFTPDELKIAVSRALEKSRFMAENIELRMMMPVFEISKELVSETDLSRVLSRAVELLLRETESDMASLMLLDEETQEPCIRLNCGFPKDMLATVRWVVEEGKPLFVSNTVSVAPQIQSEISKSSIGSLLCLPLLSKEKIVGALTLARIVGQKPFRQSHLQLLSTLCNHLAVAIENIRLFDKLNKQKQELEVTCKKLEEQTVELSDKKQQLERAYLEIIKTLALTVEARDPYTRGHSERASQFARQIALEMNLSQEMIEIIDIAARVHDIGKVIVSDGILLKPDVLTPSERAEVQRHPTQSVEILRFIDFLKDALPVIEHHHEHWDGKGYPRGLKEEQIPLGARVLAVADAYDALTSARPYRLAKSNRQAIKVLKEGAGTQWDPTIVKTLVNILRRDASSKVVSMCSQISGRKP